MSPHRWLPFAALTLAALVSAVVPAAAQDPDSLFGRPVTRVVFEVDGRVDSSASLAGLSDVRAGDPLSRRAVRSTIGNLDGIGRFDEIRALASPTAESVEITFRLVPRRPIAEVVLRGGPGAWENPLRVYLRQRYRGVPTGVRTSAVEAAARQFLRDEGYPDAAVRASTEVRAGQTGAALVLDVDAGTIARIASVNVRGRSPLSSDHVIERMGAERGRPFQRRAAEAALASLEDELRGQGYYEVRATLDAEPSPDGVTLTIEINAGPRVDVRVEPAGALPGRLADLVPVRRLGSADEDLLEDSRGRIERALRAQGYWRASAPFTRVVDPSGDRLTITFTITRGARYTVERVEVPATLSLPAEVLRQIIGVAPGDVFVDDRFVVGVRAAVDEYRRAGFYRVRAEPTYAEGAAGAVGEGRVVLHPNITEGPRGVVTEVSFAFTTPSAVSEAELRAAMRSRQGQPFVDLDAALDEDALRGVYLQRGFRNVQVTLRPAFRDDGAAVVLTADINPGDLIRIGQISVVGQDRVSERAVLDEMGLRVGQPAGVGTINDAQARLIDMGVFRRVSFASIDQYTEPETHLIVSVVEADANTVRLGGGLAGGRISRPVATGGSDDPVEFAPRGSFEITRRHVGGRNRSVSFSSRLTLRRNRSAEGGFGFPEYRVSGTFRERRAFRTDTDLLVGLTSEQAVRTGFNFVRQGANAEVLRAFSRRVSLSGRYLLDFTRLFDEQYAERDQPLIDRAFPEVRLSRLATGVTVDRRDNPLATTRGAFVTGDIEVAARAIGSEIGFVKTFLQGSAFRRLDADGRMVLAGQVQFGAARGFPRVALVPNDAGVLVEATVEDIPASQRFFAGGSTSVRGYRTDRLAVSELLNGDGLPLGGNALVVFNAEIRRVVGRLFGRNLGAVGFVDSGNVFKRASDLRLTDLESAVGVGARYDTPFGALRLDFGFKLRPAAVNGERQRGWEYHLNIGEAF